MACSSVDICSRSSPPIMASLPNPPAIDEIVRVSRQEFSTLKQQMEVLVRGQAELQSGLRQMDAMMNTHAGLSAEMRNMLGQITTDFSSMRGPPVAEAPEKSESFVQSAPKETSSDKQPKSPKAGSKSQFAIRVQERRINRLQRIFEVDEEVEVEIQRRKGITLRKRFEAFMAVNSLEKLNEIFDTAVLVVICLNAFFIGISVDRPEQDDAWFIIDFIFTMFFITELAVKTFTVGLKQEFCGNERLANLFDFTLILLDVMQLIMKIMDIAVDGPSVSLFRMVRLGRFLRIIRLCRTDKFKDLLGMISGIMGAFVTLGWAMILFSMLLYVAALLCRETLGREETEHVKEYFDTVPRSMFTVFRCSFWDCSTTGGTPIFEFVTEAYGGMYGLVYCVFMFVMTIGLFNVISAIFVDSTMSAAADLGEKKKQERLANEQLMSCNVTVLIKRILTFLPEYRINDKLSSSVNDLLQIAISRHVIDEAILDEVAINALNGLDIDPHDHDKLSDILDPDHTGTMTVLDIMNGLQRLRGEPRRSDIVSASLMIRSLQDMVEDIFAMVKRINEHT